MNNLRETKGNLISMGLRGEFDVIIHGANCFHLMGSGIAKEIAVRIPEAASIDKLTKKGSADKLGTFSATYKGDLLVMNAYTQYQPGKNVCYFSIMEFITTMNNIDELYGKRIGIPLIGCGIAGGNWEFVKRMFSSMLDENLDVTVVHFDPEAD